MLSTPNTNGYSAYHDRALCSFATGTMTLALKAQRTLARHAIRVDVIKINSANDQRGCVYGIEYPCALSGNIRSILDRAGIYPKRP